MKCTSPSAWSAARPYVVLSIAAVVTIGLKVGAYLVTGSVGLFSDVAESVVNLVAALAALWALIYAARPPDEEHAFGHNKAEYFSSGLESALIIVAAVGIGVTAWGPFDGPAAAAERGARALHHAPGRRAPPAHGCLDLYRRGARRWYGAAHRMAGA